MCADAPRAQSLGLIWRQRQRPPRQTSARLGWRTLGPGPRASLVTSSLQQSGLFLNVPTHAIRRQRPGAGKAGDCPAGIARITCSAGPLAPRAEEARFPRARGRTRPVALHGHNQRAEAREGGRSPGQGCCGAGREGSSVGARGTCELKSACRMTPLVFRS